jgi:Trypsin-like peptidase domain
MKFRREFAILALCHAVPASTFMPLSLKGRGNKVVVSPSQTYAFYSMSTDPTGPLSAESEEHNERFSSKNGQRDSFSNLSVTELKRLLIDRGIDFRDCLEKRDLVERLRESETVGFNSYQQQPSSSSPDGLMTEEVALINTFKRVSPSVANIKTNIVVPAQNGLRLRPMEVPMGTGSGFLWDDKGHVVTNFHVISMGRRDGRIPDTVKVKLAGLVEARDADVVGVEPEKDLAVLRLRDRRNLPPPIPVGTSNDLQVGQTVLAIGNPFGLDDTLTKGIVSALGRDVDGIGGRPIHGCIQTDAAINQGR